LIELNDQNSIELLLLHVYQDVALRGNNSMVALRCAGFAGYKLKVGVSNDWGIGSAG